MAMGRFGPVVLGTAGRRTKTTATTVRGGVGGGVGGLKLAEVSGPTDAPLRHETIGQAFATTVRDGTPWKGRRRGRDDALEGSIRGKKGVWWCWWVERGRKVTR